MSAWWGREASHDMSGRNSDKVAHLLALSAGDNAMLGEGDEHEEYETPSRIDSMAGAFARMCVSSLAFLFQRPVRLFRPMHFSTFSLLELMARREGKKLGIPYIRRLIRHEKPAFLLALVVPPMLANLAIGFTLFQTYTLTENAFMHDKETQFTPTGVVAIAGALAGAAQCVISAPLDNVRLIVQPLLVHDSGQRSLSPSSLSIFRAPFKTWQAIIEASALPFLPERWYKLTIRHLERVWPVLKDEPAVPGRKNREQPLRLLHDLPKNVRLLARRKHGMSLVLSLVRDALGFSAFFVSFEWARRVAYHASLRVDYVVHSVRHRASPRKLLHGEEHSDRSFSASRSAWGRTTAVIVLVCGGAIGGLLYSLVSRPVEYIRMVLWNRLYDPRPRPHAPRNASTRASPMRVLPSVALRPVRATRLCRPVPHISPVQTEHRLRVQRRRLPASLAPHTLWKRPKRSHAKRAAPRPKPMFASKSLSRLMQFARMTAPPHLLSSPTRLFMHTYFVRPFTHPDLCKASAPRPWGTAPPIRHAKLASPVVRRPFNVRVQWLLGRLLSPYACGFFVYAWMSGDLG